MIDESTEGPATLYGAWQTSGAAAEHTCPDWLPALELTGRTEPHSADRCPGPVTLEEVVSASYRLEAA